MSDNDQDSSVVNNGLTVIILEDNSSEADKISGMLSESVSDVFSRNGIEMKISKIQVVETQEELKKAIETDTKVPDWIFCDLNLRQKGAGLKVAENISFRRYPTDILLYSQASTLDTEVTEFANRYGNVWSANRDQISGTIDKMVWRIAVTIRDPEYLRGLILSRATDTESLIDDCVTAMFRIHKDLKEHFKWGLLRSEAYGPGIKYDAIASYIETLDSKGEDAGIDLEKVKGHLTHIFRERNNVAHGIATSDGEGGLLLLNRLMSAPKKKEGKPVAPSFRYSMPRKKSKDYLHLCYRAEEELRVLLEYLIKLSKK